MTTCYQVADCFGDSLTYGARTVGCWPAYLAKILTARSRYAWQLRNHAVNGHTVRDLWFVVNATVTPTDNGEPALVLIGTNDCKALTHPLLFELYFQQVLTALTMHGRIAVVGTVPLIVSRGRPPYRRAAERHRVALNAVIRRVAQELAVTTVDLRLVARDLIDGVHPTEGGHQKVAAAFAEVLLQL